MSAAQPFDTEVNQLIQVLEWGGFGDGIHGISREVRVNDRALPLEDIYGTGDSGSPALAYRDGSPYIVGISSGGNYPDEEWHAGEGKYGWIELYANAEKIRGWIKNVMKS